MKRIIKTLLLGAVFFGIFIMVPGCSNKPAWVKKNAEIIKEYNVVGRTRNDIPDTKIESNLKPGVVDNINNLPELRLGEGITAKVYWGPMALVSFIKMAPNSSFPESEIKGERFLVVMEGDVQELINGNYTSLKAIPAEEPDGIHGGVQKREFVYLLDGARTAVKAGSKGATILEVFSPVPAEYLKLAGVTNIPAPISITNFPVKPTVEPKKIYDLDQLQYTELVPGSNSKLVSGYGVQLSFLRMDPLAVFAHHIHPEAQLMVVFRGAIDEVIMDEVVTMKEGDLLYLPANMVHGGTLSPLGCDVLDVFFPPREDYEQNRQSRYAGYHAIIPADARIEVVIDGATTRPGLTFTEGPVWLNDKLYFSNMFFDQDWNGSPAKSTLVEMNVDGSYRNISQGMQTNGIIASPRNTLIVCDMFGHRIIEMDTRGNILKVLADKYDGKPLDGPNDLVMDAKGGIYFTDPQFTPDAVKNQPGRTVYYINPEGKLIRLLNPDEFAMPNGVALSPDGKILYINNTYDNETFWNTKTDKENFVWAYDVKEDGTITNGRKFAELYLETGVLNRGGKSSGADGMKVDASGNLFVCTYIGVQIFNPEGKFVGIISTPTYPVNCAFGGPDMSTLYITSYNNIYSIRTRTKGL